MKIATYRGFEIHETEWQPLPLGDPRLQILISQRDNEIKQVYAFHPDPKSGYQMYRAIVAKAPGEPADLTAARHLNAMQAVRHGVDIIIDGDGA